MDTYRILHRELPLMTGIYIPETEGLISPPRIARVFFETQEDRDRFCEAAKQDYSEFIHSFASLDNEAVIVRACGARDIVDIFHRIYGWEAVDDRLCYQSC